MGHIYDEACYLIPQWEELDEKAHNEKDILDSFKGLFKDTYYYFKSFFEEYVDINNVGEMELEVLQTYSIMVSLMSNLLVELNHSKKDDELIIYDIVYSFLENYIYKDYFHNTFKDNTFAVRTDATIDPMCYSIETYKKTGKLHFDD